MRPHIEGESHEFVDRNPWHLTMAFQYEADVHDTNRVAHVAAPSNSWMTGYV